MDTDTAPPLTEQALEPVPKPKLIGGITGKGFVKGDPRINRKGRPKTFDQLRALAQQIAHERSLSDSSVTVAEDVLRKMSKENPERFLEIAFGKVPDEVVSSGKVTVNVVYRDATDAARGATDDQAAGETL